MRRILLVEPGYRNKYPPLGLMKISSYHKLKGDFVRFVKGCDREARAEHWDRIYVSTLFTFHWKTTIDTIEYYRRSVDDPKDVVVGGIMATLLEDEVRSTTGVTVVSGLLDKPGVLDRGDRCHIDVLTPDYRILEEADYAYGLSDAYIAYATRGCPNRCKFCAVSSIEPVFVDYLPLVKQVRSIEEMYGPKANLVLLDNNVLASERFDRIIDDIVRLGFERGARFGRRRRHVDFNQGIDIRRLTPEKMSQLARIALSPLRLAFDHIQLKDEYIDRVRMAVNSGITSLSNYVLYNYTDTPADFYERLRINVELNQELGTQIYSFPMKYIPLDAKDRTHIGEHWNRRLLRGVQCILLATKGKVGTHLDFFEAAFGRTVDEFVEIAMMPEDYIIHRRHHASNGAAEWREAFRALSKTQRTAFIEIVSGQRDGRGHERFAPLLAHYAPGHRSPSRAECLTPTSAEASAPSPTPSAQACTVAARSDVPAASAPLDGTP